MYKVIVDHNPSQSDNDVIKEGLIKSYEAQFGERDKELSLFLKNNGKVFGGIQAMFDSEAIYIEALWIEENLRKQGYGKKLLAAAEREAIENGCRFSLVDTWDFQAEEFYLKNGYEKIGKSKIIGTTIQNYSLEKNYTRPSSIFHLLNHLKFL